MSNLQRLQNIYTNTLVITDNYLKNNCQSPETLARNVSTISNIHQMNEAELLNKIELMTQIMLPQKNKHIEYC